MTRVSRTPVSFRWAILGAAWVLACRLGAPSDPAASPTSTLIPPDASEPAAGPVEHGYRDGRYRARSLSSRLVL